MTNQQDKEQTQSSPSARKHFKKAPSRFTVMLLMLLFFKFCALLVKIWPILYLCHLRFVSPTIIPRAFVQLKKLKISSHGSVKVAW